MKQEIHYLQIESLYQNQVLKVQNQAQSLPYQKHLHLILQVQKA